MTYKILLKRQKMHFYSMSVILLHSDYRHVSATHVAIFRLVSEEIQLHYMFRDHSTVNCGVCSNPDTL
jgi:hypothetical protein